MFVGIGIPLMSGAASSPLAQYAVLGFQPELVFDFETERYRTNGTSTTFSDAITHTRASTATYVDSSGVLQTAASGEPRVGHHVWNGSAWVNEGLLHESEARTNLDANSSVITASTGTSVNSNTQTAPDGTLSADEVVENSATGQHNSTKTITATGSKTYSVFAKQGSGNRLLRLIDFNVTDGGQGESYFDLSAGTVVSGPGKIETYGNGWYRCSIQATTTVTSTFFISLASSAGVFSYTGDGTSSLYLWGAQLEAGPTPSSYIPTSGSTVTRAADVLTIPSANLPWPSPVVIGSELVTNGTFDTDTTGWTALFGSISWSGGKLLLTEDGADGSSARAYQGITTEVGKVYRVTADVGAVSLGNAAIVASTSTNIGGFPTVASTGNETVELIFVAAATTTNIIVSVQGTSARTAEFDNISVREINPLAVSIQMDGKITYADTDEVVAINFVSWQLNASNRIYEFVTTSGGATGKIGAQQIASGVVDASQEAGNTLSPGILVPYNFAARHGSTFVNGAIDGTALTANTTPTALPDLSATDLSLGFDYMGTIRTFRVWANDIGNAGIEEAST